MEFPYFVILNIHFDSWGRPFLRNVRDSETAGPWELKTHRLRAILKAQRMAPMERRWDSGHDFFWVFVAVSVKTPRNLYPFYIRVQKKNKILVSILNQIYIDFYILLQSGCGIIISI